MTRPPPRIAIVEDNADLCAELIDYLQAQGYPVWGADSAGAFWRTLHRNTVDIVLVDINLPGEDGFGVVRYLRELGSYGLIIMTARGDLADRHRGLQLGADRYLIKPVNFARLCEDIQSLWKRQQSEVPLASDLVVDTSSASAWELDPVQRRLLPSGAASPLTLTPQELALLQVLMLRPGIVCTKQELHDAVFGPGPEADLHRIDVILSRLRQKAINLGYRLPIRTLFGRGLVFLTNDAPYPGSSTDSI